MWKVKEKKKALHVFSRKCVGCEMCVEACRRNVLGMFYKREYCYATVEFPDRCTGCGKCVEICPFDAIELM